MNVLIIYLIGWFILSLLYFLFKVFKDKNPWINKKVCAWRAIWVGIFSWGGIIVIVSFLLVGAIIIIEDWIETKLNSF